MDKTNVKKISRQLLDALPHGSIKKIATEYKFAWDSVNQILQGKWTNRKVVEAAIKIIREEHEKTGDFLSMVDELEKSNQAA